MILAKGTFLMRADDLSAKGRAVRDLWLEEIPELKKAYELKELFFGMYDCRTKAEAEWYFREWERSVPREFSHFKSLCRTVRRSYKEIFNYFEAPAPYTNALLEGLNSVIRRISNQGCGEYDFEILRGKVLLTAGKSLESREYKALLANQGSTN